MSGEQAGEALEDLEDLEDLGTAELPPERDAEEVIEAAAPSWRRWLGTAIKLAVAAAMLTWILSNPRFEWSKIASALLSPGTAMILVLGFVGISASGLRWLLLMRGEGIQVPLWIALKLTWIGHFWNMVIPGAVSGDAVKMYYVGQVAPERREEAWSTVLADRVIGLSALIALAALASLWRIESMWANDILRLVLIAMVAGLCAIGLGALIVATGLGRNWAIVQVIAARVPGRALLGRVYGSLQRIGRRPGTVLVAFVISFCAHGVSILNAFLLGRALGEQVLPFTHYAAVFPVALFSNAVPISPGGGIGVGEAVIGLLFEFSATSLGADAESLKAQGAMIMICHRVVFYVLALIGAALYVFYRREQAKPAPSA